MESNETMHRELKAARAIAEKAESENRDLTPDEVEQATTHLKAYESAKTSLTATPGQNFIREDSETGRALKSIGINPWSNPDDAMSPRAKGAKRTKRSAMWSKGVADRIDSMSQKIVGDTVGMKALVSGSISVPSALDQGQPVTIDTVQTTVLDLIARGEPDGNRQGNEFQYVRQTARDSQAGAVADLDPKPTSTYTFGEVKDHFRVYANKTEDLPYRYLSDHATLTDVIREQLAEDTLLAIEEDALSGAGTGEELTGILNTSGIQAQPFDTDRLTTLSNAKYKLLGQELAFDGWVLNPTDLQALELLREGGTTGPFLFKSRAEIAAFLGAPIALSQGIPAGTALVGNFEQGADLIPKGDDELVVDTKKRTDNNTFLLMYEGSYGFRVKKPVSFVEVTLTGA
ncbi:phage major capsid protein [Microbacterium sp. G2-8]|uniref:phage major capsid protein n=1 Tax=Microbacterium sp. G2-8 TaxID=2842454 RepID=UPI001C8A1010|nr:phage major capsid protein [Microbacterium sp. G2-8]